MKVSQLLSLFFYAAVICCSLCVQICYAQQDQDSSYYYYEKALNPKAPNELTEAYQFYSKQVNKGLAQKDTISSIQATRMKAIIEFNLGFYKLSEETTVKGLKLLDNLKENTSSNEAKKGLYNQLGKIYRNLNNPDVALQYYNKVLFYSSSLLDSLTVLNNKANIYRDILQFDKAIIELSTVYQKSLKLNDTVLIARALDNLGFVQSKVQLPQALDNLNAAYNLRIKNNDIKGQYTSLSHLSEYYFEKGNKSMAIKYAKDAYQIATEIKSVSFIEDAISRLLELHQDDLVVSYIKLNDSITKAKNRQQNAFASMQYDVAKEKSRADKNQLLKEKEKNRSKLFLIIGISIFIMALLIIWNLKSNFKKEKFKKVVETENRISKKVHDELANDVYQIMSKLEAENPNNEMLDQLDDIYSKSRDISKSLSQLDVKNNFQDQLKDLLLSYNNQNTAVIYRNLEKLEWNKVSELKKVAIFRVLQELLTNMKKHSEATNVLLAFGYEKNKIGIEYKDNGKGCNLEKNSGLQSAENRIESINGKIIFDSQPGKGFKVKITV